MGNFIRVSRVGLTLVFLFTTFAKEVHADNANITWTSPVEGDKYGPGDTIIGKWNTVKAVVSPSFRLCVSANISISVSNSASSSDDGCGSTVWPTVKESAGSFFISLATPKVTADEGFFLRMEDDFGQLIFSPVFILSPTPVSATHNVGNGPGSDSSDTGVPDSPSPAPINPQPSTSATPANVAATPTATSDANVHSINPYIALSRTPPPLAAFAVPLSLVGAILLIAGGLSFRHYRNLGAERARDAEKLDLSRRSSMSTFTSTSTRHSEVKHALDVLAMDDRYGPAVPAFPVDIRREQRRSTRQAAPMYAATPKYARSSNTAPNSAFQPATNPPAYAAQVVVPSREDDDINATVTHSVISDYLLPSPIPPHSLLSAPQQLHVRSEASMPRSNVYSYDSNKPLPRSPQARLGGKDIYDAVAQAVGRRVA